MASLLDPRLHDPGYTPGRGELPGLVRELMALDREAARPLERALGRAGFAAAEAALLALDRADEAGQARLLSLIARVAGETSDPRLLSPLLLALESSSLRCRRVAASGLGKLGDPQAETALLEALRDPDISLGRVVVEALGKLGGPASVAALEALSSRGAEFERHIGRARTLLKRRLGRSTVARIVLDRALGGTARIAVFCRAGLSSLLLDELRHLQPRGRDRSRVDLQYAGTLADLFAASRVALGFGLVVPISDSNQTPAERIGRALQSPRLLAWLRAWTDGPLRFRLEFASGGHQRELAWAIAEKLSVSGSALQNDPRRADWIAQVPAGFAGELILVPRVPQDPRFSYRARDVHAASHPTLAAALARVAAACKSDVVWDPFLGSGLELVECARLGSYRRLLGSDLDPRAIEAARENLTAASIERVELLLGDALELAPKGVTLILSNPPMGRRVARDGSVGELLERFTTHAADVLEGGGRMVWLSPLPRLTARAAERAKLLVEPGPELDMGGFSAQIQVFKKARP